MAVPTGPASLLDIQNEFGASNPIGLNEYYAGGANVGNPPPTSGFQTGPIPTSGTISIGNFLGVAAAFVFNDTITSGMSPFSNYNLRNRAIAAGWNGTSALIATVMINSGVTVTSTSTGTPAFTLGTISAGSTLSLTNNGTIAGRGGAGGTGGTFNGAAGPYSPSNSSGYTQGSAGGTGGQALNVGYPITITNNGTIGGGGGGGGGAGASYLVDGQSKGVDWGSGGSGGGGGRASGTGGAFGGCNMNGAGFGQNGQAGGAGTISAPGTGGSITVPGYGTRSGGNGGDLGQPGTAGQHGDINVDSATWGSSGGGGGAAGAAVVGGANITWNAFGTRLGSIDNPGTNNTGGAINDHANKSLNDACPGIGCNSSVWVNFYTDGDERGFAQGNVLQYNDSWYTPETSGIGNSHWIRADVVSGSAPNTGDAENVWLQLNAVRSWGHTTNSGVRSGTLRVRIATDSGGVNVVFDVNYSMFAEGGGF